MEFSHRCPTCDDVEYGAEQLVENQAMASASDSEVSSAEEDSGIDLTTCKSISEEALQPIDQIPIRGYTETIDVFQQLGKGSYGETSEIRYRGQRYAMKRVFHSRTSARVEINVLRRVFHPRIVRMLFHTKDARDFRYLLIMELLDINLRRYFNSRQRRPMPIFEIRHITRQILEGIEFLHNARILHADLKPDNVMVVDSKKTPVDIKIIDFGTAMTPPMNFLEKPLQTTYYRAPEVCVGLPITELIDIWSIGCMMAEFYCGRVLFPATDNRHLMGLITELLGLHIDYTSCYYFDEYILQSQETEGLFSLKEHPRPRAWEFDDLDGIVGFRRRCLSQEEFEADAHEADAMLCVLKGMLRLSPRQRQSAEVVLKLPFFAEQS